jgi:hypothetical protein
MSEGAAWPDLETVSLEGGVAAALDALPDAPGIAQLLAGDRNLLIGRGASVRGFVASRLGRGPQPKPGQRPPLDLSPVATAVRHARTFTEFGQLLAFERLMATWVAAESRPDLKPPFWIHVDLEAPFPRLSCVQKVPGRGRAFGPFRSRSTAQDAIDRLHGVLPLRPCDYTFEPHPELSLGLGCVFAQVATCAAPCLERITADAYRTLAREAVLRLERGDDATLGLLPFVSDREGRAVVTEVRADGTVELYPVHAGHVCEEARVEAESIEAAPVPRASARPGAADDWPWLSAWLHGRRRRGQWLREAASRVEPAGPAMVR